MFYMNFKICFRNLVLLEVIFFDISISHTDVFQYDGNYLGQSFCRLVTWFLVDSLIFLCRYACLPVPQNTPHQEKKPELLDFADLSSCSGYILQGGLFWIWEIFFINSFHVTTFVMGEGGGETEDEWGSVVTRKRGLHFIVFPIKFWKLWDCNSVIRW